MQINKERHRLYAVQLSSPAFESGDAVGYMQHTRNGNSCSDFQKESEIIIVLRAFVADTGTAREKTARQVAIVHPATILHQPSIEHITETFGKVE